MQIRTIFHNADFLKKGTPNADARPAHDRVLKAGRRLVCVMLMLVACVGAVWGAQFRLKNASATGEQSWDSSSTWQDSSLGLSWGNADYPPTSSDRVYLQGAAGVETVIRLTSSITVDQLIINSDNAAGGTIRFVADAGVTITVNHELCLGLPDNGGTVNLILDNVSLSCSSLEVNDDVNNHHKNDGNLVISGTGTAQITAGTVNVFADKANSPGAMSIDFGNVPLTATDVNINSDDKTGGVTIETDSIIDAGTVTIGGSNAGNTNTTFGGTGSIDVDTWGGNSASAGVTINSGLTVPNNPTDPDSYTITVGSFDNFATSEANNSVSLTITVVKENSLPDGTPLNVPFTLTQTRDDLFSLDHQTLSGTPPGANLIFWNPDNKTYTRNDITLACYSWNTLQDGDGFTLKIYSTQNVLLKTIEWHYEVPDAYSFTATGVDTFTGSGDNNQIDVRITSAVAGNSISYTFERSETSTGDAKFTLNDLPNTSGNASFNSSPYEKNWPIKAVQPLEEGDGFTLTVKRSDGSVLGTVTWTKPGAKWTGAVSSDWNTLGNWSGITSLAELETKDVTIDSSYTRAPEISSTATVKSLTIAAGKQVTLSGGTLTTESLACAGGTFTQIGGTLAVGSIVCTGAGSFSGTGGTVSFNGAAGTWSAVAGTSVFNNVSLASGAALTMSSPLHLTGNLDVSEGTLTAGATVVFEGSGTQASPQTIKASSVPFGSLTFAGDGSSGYIQLLSNVMCSSAVTVDEDITLDCNGYMLNVSGGTLTNNGTIICSEGASAGMLMCGTYVPSDYGTDVVSVSGAVTLVVSGDGEISKIKVTDSAEITGSAACSFFEATGLGGKTLTITGQLRIGSGVTGTDATETLKLSGTSSSSKLEIAGAGSIKLNKTQVGGQYLNVTATAEIHDLSSDTAPIAFTATYSTGTAPSGWNICSGDLVYVWTGAAGSTTWSTPDNWSVGMVPEDTSADVEIPAGLTRYPVSPSSQLSINSLTVADGASVSVADDNKLRFVSYSGDGVIKLGTGNIEVRSAGTSCTIKNIEFTGTGTRSFADINKVTLVNLKVPSGKTLQLSGDLTLTGEMDNAGTIDTNGKTLTFKTYTGAGTVQIGTEGNVAVGSSGTGGTIKNVVFTVTRDYVAPANVTFTNGTINSGVTLTVITNLLSFGGDLTNKGSIKLSGAGLTVSGNIDNQGTVNCNNRPFTFASYTNTSSNTDKILVNGIGGSVTCTGSGTGSGAVAYAELNGSSTVVTNSGTGTLKFTSALISVAGSSLTLTTGGSGSFSFDEINVNANATLTQTGTASSFTFTKISIDTGKTLTLNNALTAGTLTNSGTVTTSAGTLTVTGTLTNSGTVSCDGFDLTAGTLKNNGSIVMTAATGGNNLTCTTYTPSSTSADSMTLSGDVTLNVGTNKVSTINYSAGTLTAGAAGLKTGTLKVTAGTAVLAGTMNVTTLSVVGSTTVEGAVTADSCSATGLGGKTLTVNGTLKVTSAGTAAAPVLKLEGSSTSSRLSVSGTGTISINGSQVGGKWLSVSTSGPAIKDLSSGNTVIYTATYSIPSGSTAMEFNGWYLCDEGLVYKWKGGTSGAWGEATNWAVRSVPVSSSDVEIPDVTGTGNVSLTTSGAVTVNSLSLAENMTLTMGGSFTVSNGLTNNGTINTNGQSLKFKTYNETTTTGARLIKIGATDGLSSPTGTGGTISNIEFTATRNGQNGSANGFTDLQGLVFKNAKVDSGVALTLKARAGQSSIAFTGTFENSGTVTLGNSVSITGALTNNGTIDMQNNSLSCGSYADSTENGLIKLGTGMLNPGSGGTLNNIEFTATRSFENITGLTIKKGTVDSGVSLTVTSGGLSFTGNFTNNGTITLNGNLSVTGRFENKGTVTINNKALSFGTYSWIGTSDSISVNSGTITSAGNGGTITSASLKGTVTVKKTGTGALTLATVTVTDDGTNLTVTNDNGTGALSVGTTSFTGNATLTVGGTGSTPVMTTVNVGSGKTLTLGSALAVSGTLTNNGTVSSTGFNLSAGTLKNNGNITLTAGGSGNNISGTYTKDTGITADKMTLSGDVMLSIGTARVSTIAYGGGTLTASGTVNAGSLTVSGSAATLTGTMNVAGNLAASSALTIAGGTSVGGNLTANSGLTVTGTVSVTGDLTASADVTVSGTASVTGALKATDCSVTVAAGKTLSAGTYKQTAASSGKSLTVNGTLRVGSGKTSRDTLRISGGSGTLLTVDGSGSIQLNLSQVGGDYLSVSSSGPQVTQLTGGPDIVLSAIHSTGPASPATAPAGWYICSGDLIFVWKGGYDGNQTSWNEERNWSVHIVPNANAINAASNTEANIGPVIVEIPSVTYSPVTSGAVQVKDLTMVSGMSLTLNGNFTATNNLISDGSITLQSGNMAVQNNLTNNGTITQNGNVSVSGTLTNTGTIDMKNNNLSCGSYADSTENGLIKLGTGTLTPGTGGTLKNIEFTASRDGQGTHPAGFENIANLTIKNGTVDAGVALTITSGGLSFTGTLLNKGFITQNGNLSVNGALTNNGTIDMKNKNLSCGSYADDAANRLIKLGTGTLDPGSGGTLNNIEFTATRSFEDITALTITNGKLNAGQTLTVTSGGLSFTGNFTNNGTIMQNGDLTVGGRLDNTGSISIGSSALQFGWYTHTDTLNDALTIAGGSITTTGNGTGMLKINSLAMNGNATITNNGTGNLRFEAVTVNADSLLTSGGSGSAPVYSNLLISGSNTLTLASDVTAGTVTIDSSATLDADNRGKNANPNFAGYVLTITGNLINNNTTLAETDSIVYRGFIPQSGKVVITGNGGTRHDIKGNVKFNDFYCHEAGAKLYFDIGTTINVDHQIDLEGAAGQLLEMTTDSTVEGEKWTLDVIWDVAAGTLEHPKPKIKYVAPHKSISYSAILKGCLDNCVDDVTELLDSTNVNWFNDMPTILMTLAPVGGRQLFVLFSTEVTAASGCDLRTALALTSAGGSNIIDPTVPLTSYTGTTDKSKTAYVFGLTRDLTWNDLYGSDCLHVEVVQTSAVRVGTTRISYQQGVKHATSDFAVNAARMLFGYDNYIDSSNPLTPESGTNSVRTWDGTDYISNRLHSDSDLLFQAQFDASVPDGMKLEMVAQYASELNTGIIGDNYNDYYGLSTRLWLPAPDNFLPLSTVAQTLDASQKIAQDSTSSGRLRNFSLHYSKSSSVPLFQMKDGEEIQFLFKVKNPDGSDLLIDHDYDEGNGIYTPTERHPVYAIRLVDDKDISTFDLWSVALQSTTLQRGNVTILNNVINADQKEQTFVTIQTQKAGSLTVQVLTLDGAVITTLERGRKQAGTWGYSWDGTNGKGKPVARGMYFIRVIGPDIDETRKVMVVRD